MVLRDPLNSILDRKGKVRILRFLCRKGGEWTGRRLAAELGLNPATTHRMLKELHRETILDFRRMGANSVYSLRDRHYLVQELLRPLYDREAQAQDQLLGLICKSLDSRLKAQVATAALYGSVARGEERPTSDIDLVVLVKSQRNRLKVRQALEPLWEVVAERFGNTLNLYLNTVREAQEKHRRRLPLFKSILRDHRLVFGTPLEEVLHGRSA